MDVICERVLSKYEKRVLQELRGFIDNRDFPKFIELVRNESERYLQCMEQVPKESGSDVKGLLEKIPGLSHKEYFADLSKMPIQSILEVALRQILSSGDVFLLQRFLGYFADKLPAPEFEGLLDIKQLRNNVDVTDPAIHPLIKRALEGSSAPHERTKASKKDDDNWWLNNMRNWWSSY